MNKLVKKHYPVERLPADLRSELKGVVRVRVELEPETSVEGHRVSQLVGTGRNVHGDVDQVIKHVEELREDR